MGAVDVITGEVEVEVAIDVNNCGGVDNVAAVVVAFPVATFVCGVNDVVACSRNRKNSLRDIRISSCLCVSY